MRRELCLGLLLVIGAPATWACQACVPLVEAGIYGENFVRHLLLMLLPIAALVAIAVVIYRFDRIRGKAKERKGP